MKRIFLIIVLLLTAQLNAMTESKQSVAQENLYKQKAQEFFGKLSKDKKVYKYVYEGLSEVKWACNKLNGVKILDYAYMAKQRQPLLSSTVADDDDAVSACNSDDESAALIDEVVLTPSADAEFVQNYGILFSNTVWDIACQVLEISLVDLHCQCGLGGFKQIKKLIVPHMLALASAVLVHLEPQVFPAKL